MKALRSLPAAKLSALADALSSGELRAPLSAFAVARVIGDVTPEVVTALEALCSSGPGAALRLLADERREVLESEPELVWSGPDGFAHLRDTAVVVRQLFTDATREVLVSGFVVREGREIFRELATRMDEHTSLEVRLFLNVAAEPGVSDQKRLLDFARELQTRQWPGRRLPKVYYDPRSLEPIGSRAALHAKTVVVDRSIALVTSANLTPHAQQRNIELGVLIRSPELAKRVVEQFDSLVEHRHVLRLPGF